MNYAIGCRMKIPDLGEYHWSILLTKTVGFLFGKVSGAVCCRKGAEGYSCVTGTVMPTLPLGEKLLVWIHTQQIKNRLRLRGTRE